jgi:hypothetical protein
MVTARLYGEGSNHTQQCSPLPSLLPSPSPTYAGATSHDFCRRIVTRLHRWLLGFSRTAHRLPEDADDRDGGDGRDGRDGRDAKMAETPKSQRAKEPTSLREQCLPCDDGGMEGAAAEISASSTRRAQAFYGNKRRRVASRHRGS